MDGVGVLSDLAMRHQRVNSSQTSSSTTLHAPEGECAADGIEKENGAQE